VSRRSLSVLCDLRPAFDGFFGIPQEARLMFRLLHDLEGIEITGLINHPTLVLARGHRRHRAAAGKPVETVRTLSRLVASATPATGASGALRDRAKAALNFPWLQLQTALGIPLPLDRFDGTEFGDFLWQALFSRSLPSAEFERCRAARYAALWAPWSTLHATAFLPWPRQCPRIDTTGYDVLVAHTPWPGTPAPETRLVVRYHDAMPVFLPHTVKQPRLHNFFHLSALRENAKSALFACVSQYSRTKLLQIFPELERRAFVVHDCIADAYFPAQATRESVSEIVTARVDPATEPDLGSGSQRRSFYDSHVAAANFRYLLVVATLEPRKNHLGLLAAWEALRLQSRSPVALVFVGSPGWGNKILLRAMQKWQQRGELFHLSAVPPSEMRLLYSAAEAVICPSVSEGFDLPGVEALRCGSAVAASDIPTHREMLGEAALYFDPYSTTSMCDALMRVLSDKDVRGELRQRAAPQAAKFETATIGAQWQEVFDYCRTNAGAAR
jgi:glycosyltransferase involved in cell wall biosynthesis